jgi:hypothetical protein
VLDKLAEKGDWGKPLSHGVGRGLAIHEAFGTIVGEIAEVAISKGGEVKVQRVLACVDCGHVVNPLNVEMQIESAILYGLTAALFGEITIQKGRVEQGNFDDSSSRTWRTRRSSRRISHCRAAENGVASVSLARRRSRPLSLTRSSPPQAGAFGPCR